MIITLIMLITSLNLGHNQVSHLHARARLLTAMTNGEPKPNREKEAWELARPHKYMFGVEADSLVCLFRLNPAEAKKYCSDLDVIDGNTGADEIMLSMFRKLQGSLEPTGNVLEEGTRNEKGAARYCLGKKLGRPPREVAAAEAAARLVGTKWRQYKQQQAKKQRDKSAHAAARAARPTVGRFTSRGNAMTCVKAAAIVQVWPFSYHAQCEHTGCSLYTHCCLPPVRTQTSQFAALINRTNCSCGERLSFHEKGSSQVRLPLEFRREGDRLLSNRTVHPLLATPVLTPPC